MKVRIITTLIFFCLLFTFAACSKSDGEEHPEAGNGAAGATGVHHAYYTVFEDLFENDPSLNENARYLAIDLSNTNLADASPLIELMQEFCDNNGYTLIQDELVGLINGGYVVELEFVSGFIIIFIDSEQTPEKLVTSAVKWRSITGAIGANYTVELKNEEWEITKTENQWAS